MSDGILDEKYNYKTEDDIQVDWKSDDVFDLNTYLSSQPWSFIEKLKPSETILEGNLDVFVGSDSWQTIEYFREFTFDGNDKRLL